MVIVGSWVKLVNLPSRRYCQLHCDAFDKVAVIDLPLGWLLDQLQEPEVTVRYQS